MATVGIVDIGASLEAHTIVAGAVQMGRGVEIVYLLRLDTCNRVVVHLRENVGVGLTTANACRGNEVGVYREALGKEYLIAGANHTAVVQVDIVDKEPCADAVVGECAALFSKLHDILVEEQAHLVLRVGCQVMGRGIVEVTELTMAHFVKAALGQTCLNV